MVEPIPMYSNRPIPGNSDAPLNPAGESDNSGGMEREQIEDMIAASDARTDTKFERILGEMRTEFANVRGDIAALKAATAGKGTVILTGVSVFIGLATLLAAFAAFGAQWFGLGMQGHDVLMLAAKEGAAQALAAHH